MQPFCTIFGLMWYVCLCLSSLSQSYLGNKERTLAHICELVFLENICRMCLFAVLRATFNLSALFLGGGLGTEMHFPRPLRRKSTFDLPTEKVLQSWLTTTITTTSWNYLIPQRSWKVNKRTALAAHLTSSSQARLATTRHRVTQEAALVGLLHRKSNLWHKKSRR